MVEQREFAWRPGRAVCTGMLWIVAAILIHVGALRRSIAAAASGGVLLALGIVALGGRLDRFLPSVPAANLEVVIEPRLEARHEVLLGAHYDSKTELFDHVERTVWMALTAMLGVGALACLRSQPQWARVLASPTALGLAVLGAHLTSAAWLPARSHGILDDGAACAVLVSQAVRLHERPLDHTRVRCVWWAGEETGAQGSRSDAQRARGLPDAVVNLECIGAGPRLAYAALEWTGRGLSSADAQLVAGLETAGGRLLARLPFPVITDAGSWRRRGARAVTLLGLPARGGVPRHLHGPGDRREALDEPAVDATQELVALWLAVGDSTPRMWPGTPETQR